MVEASKFWFDKACGASECHELIHPWMHSCTDATASMLLHCIKGSYKFYAVVYLVQILMKGKQLNKAEMLEQFKLYLKSGVFGLTVASSFVTLNCIFRRLFFNKFHYYSTVLLPCTVSGLAIFFEPPHRRILVVNLFVNLVFEYWVRTLEMKGWLRRSPGGETLLFMIGSAVFFYLMRKEKENEKQTPIFWFFTPPRVSREVGKPSTGIYGRNPACPHSGPCLNYILKGTAQLFGVGSAMTILRTIIPNILTPGKALRSLRLSHLKLGVFFGGYIGIYRLVSCALCRARGRDAAAHALPAGLLAGAALRAAPATPVALAPLTSTLQLLGSAAARRGLVPRWPLAELLYCACQGLLFHARVMHEDACPRYIVNLMRTVTSSKADEIQGAFIQKILRSV